MILLSPEKWKVKTKVLNGTYSCAIIMSQYKFPVSSYNDLLAAIITCTYFMWPPILFMLSNNYQNINCTVKKWH
jgi:hypothetical protein